MYPWCNLTIFPRDFHATAPCVWIHNQLVHRSTDSTHSTPKCTLCGIHQFDFAALSTLVVADEPIHERGWWNHAPSITRSTHFTGHTSCRIPQFYAKCTLCVWIHSTLLTRFSRISGMKLEHVPVVYTDTFIHAFSTVFHASVP